MAKLTKTHPETQLAKVKRLMSEAGKNYDTTPLSGRYDMQGNILEIETDDATLLQILADEGFT